MSSGVIKRISLDDEYKKKTGITREDISKFREWLKTQPHLPEEHITDLDLILAYNCCNNSSAVSKQVFDLNLTLRTLFTSFFKDRYMNERMETALKCCLYAPLEKRTEEGYVVFYGCYTGYDVKNMLFSEVLRLQLMIMDLHQYEEGTCPGMVIVFDLQHMQLSIVPRLDIQSLQQYIYYLQEAILVNLKAMYVINAPPFMDKIMMLSKPFTKQSVLDLFHIHVAGSKTLAESFPVDALPKEAGGTYKSLKELESEMLAKLNANKDFFVEENKKRVVESLRPGKPKTITDIFGGVEGSFKKLELD